MTQIGADVGIPRLYAAASLKPERRLVDDHDVARIPRLYAAASLKRMAGPDTAPAIRTYSAALCRGLIEARTCPAD